MAVYSVRYSSSGREDGGMGEEGERLDGPGGDEREGVQGELGKTEEVAWDE